MNSSGGAGQRLSSSPGVRRMKVAQDEEVCGQHPVKEDRDDEPPGDEISEQHRAEVHDAEPTEDPSHPWSGHHEKPRPSPEVHADPDLQDQNDELDRQKQRI